MSWLVSSFALSYLNDFLKDYIDGIDPDKFVLDLSSGTVDLKDLRVKPKKITDLGILPKGCKLAYSHVGRLHAVFQSYTTLKQTVVVELHDVELVFINDENNESNTNDNSNNPLAAFAAASDSAWGLKKNTVDVAWSAFEYEDEDDATNHTNGTKNKDMPGKRGGWKMFDNIQIEIRNLHIRFEDTVTTKETTGTEAPFSGGIYLDSLALFSTDARGQPIIVKDSEAKGFYHRRLVLDGLGFYWSVDMKKSDIIGKDNNKQWRNNMKHVLQSLRNRNKTHKGSYRDVVPPCTFQVQLVEAHGYEDQTEMPKWDLTLSTKIFEICLVEAALRDTGQLAELTNDNYFLRPRRRPNKSPELCRAWWRYAIRQVRYIVSQRRTGPNGTLRRTTSIQWKETQELFQAHCEYRKIIQRMSRCTLKNKTMIIEMKKKIEEIERYKLGIKGILHARRVVMVEYYKCTALMKGESTTTLDKQKGKNRGENQGYLASAYDWWYSAPTQPQQQQQQQQQQHNSTETKTNSKKNLRNKTFSERNANIVNTISEEAIDLANYLNVSCRLDIHVFKMSCRNIKDTILIQAELAGSSSVDMWANGTWIAKSKITRLDVIHPNSKHGSLSFLSEREIDEKDTGNDKTKTTKKTKKTKQKRVLDRKSVGGKTKSGREHVLRLDLASTVNGKAPVVFDINLSLVPMQIVLDLPCLALLSDMFGRAFTDRQKNQAATAGVAQLELLLETAKEGMVDSIPTTDTTRTTTKSNSSLGVVKSKQSILRVHADLTAPIVVVPFLPTEPNGKVAIFDLGRLLVEHGKVNVNRDESSGRGSGSGDVWKSLNKNSEDEGEEEEEGDDDDNDEFVDAESKKIRAVSASQIVRTSAIGIRDIDNNEEAWTFQLSSTQFLITNSMVSSKIKKKRVPSFSFSI